MRVIYLDPGVFMSCCARPSCCFGADHAPGICPPTSGEPTGEWQREFSVVWWYRLLGL